MPGAAQGKPDDWVHKTAHALEGPLQQGLSATQQYADAYEARNLP